MEDSDLMYVFKNVTKDDLDPLVSFILEQSTEGLSKTANYKKYHPNHTLYIEDIAKEIKLFGGNTVVNLFRGDGVNYRELLTDAADQLKIKFSNIDSIENIEQKILSKIRDKVLEHEDYEDKHQFFKAIEKECISITTGSSCPGGFPIANATNTFLGSGPLSYLIAGTLFATINITGPAYEVTIPCICHLAFLRQQINHCK